MHQSLHKHYRDYVIFGVVSNRCTNFNCFPMYLVDPCGISAKRTQVFEMGDWNTIGFGCDMTTIRDYKAFESEDIICIEYEISSGNKCKLSFYNESENNTLLHTIDLPNDEGITNWYPVFSKPNWGGSIKVIPY